MSGELEAASPTGSRAIAERILDGAGRPVVLIDGRSGAGKTTLAQRLAPLLGGQLVSLDDIYPGWDGLAAGSAAVPGMLAGPDAGWRRWDWTAGRAAEWHPVDPDRAIVVEGCGAISAASRALATFAIWMDGPADERRARALARDPGYAPFWDRWAAQEEAHIEREDPRALADLVLGPA